MTDEKSIPIVVGVTAHRAIRAEDYAAIYAAVSAELKKLQELCPDSQLVMLSSLAEGGDLLCADAAEALGLPLIAALPRERGDFTRDFSEQALERFEHHCARAEQVFVVPPTEKTPAEGVTRDYEFRQAGIYVSSHSHVLLALWDGGEGTKAACGTAETVDFTLHGSYCPAVGVSVRSASNEAVIHVFTPRAERTDTEAGTVRVLGNRRAVREVLRRTDEFNRLATALPDEDRRLLPEDCADDPALRRMEKLYLASSALSRAAAKTYRHILAAIAVISSLLTMAFLLYDEAQALWMILVCGAMLAGAFCLSRQAVKLDCHRRYLEFRALAECLRVQSFLRFAGSAVDACTLLSWTQQEETAWIMDALCVLTIGERAEKARDIASCWVEEQRSYHRRAARKVRRESEVSDLVVRVALILSISLYVLAVLFELLCGGLIFPPAIKVASAEGWRTFLKIALGSISAVTLFTANYFGRLSIPRRCSDHSKMERFFGKIAVQLQLQGQTDELLTALAREELTENGNWCSYQRDNTPNLNL